MPCRRSTALAKFWRLIPLRSAPAAEHMAVDRWLLEQFLAGQSPPVLRFYTWSRPAVSVGYHQRALPQVGGLDVVRRPTGGRAVLHQGDLTYGLVTAAPPGPRQETYVQLCQFLVAGLAAVGLPVAFGNSGGYQRSSNCFATATGADLVCQRSGGKRVGSAQLRRRGALLQHGSILLRPDGALFEQVFSQPAPSLSLPSPLAALPLQALQQRVAAALVQAAAIAFAAELVPQPLSAAEITQAVTAYGEAVQRANLS